MDLLTAIMKVGQILTDENKTLFLLFCEKALGHPRPNEFLRNALRRAIEDGDGVTVVEVVDRPEKKR